MLFEIVKFYNNVENDSYKFQEISIEEYLQIKKYSRFFKHNHIIQWLQAFGPRL